MKSGKQGTRVSSEIALRSLDTGVHHRKGGLALASGRLLQAILSAANKGMLLQTDPTIIWVGRGIRR